MQLFLVSSSHADSSRRQSLFWGTLHTSWYLTRYCCCTHDPRMSLWFVAFAIPRLYRANKMELTRNTKPRMSVSEDPLTYL
jgi:hypothetical protein